MLFRSRLTNAVQAIGSAHSIPTLADAVVREIRDLTGYDRVMVYRFDADGHGEIIAEARKAELEPFLGRHYPSTDIPQRARDLYLRNRVRVLVDVLLAVRVTVLVCVLVAVAVFVGVDVLVAVLVGVAVGSRLVML